MDRIGDDSLPVPDTLENLLKGKILVLVGGSGQTEFSGREDGCFGLNRRPSSDRTWREDALRGSTETFAGRSEESKRVEVFLNPDDFALRRRCLGAGGIPVYRLWKEPA